MEDAVVIKVRVTRETAARIEALAQARRWSKERLMARAARVVTDVLDGDGMLAGTMVDLLDIEAVRERRAGESPRRRGRPSKVAA